MDETKEKIINIINSIDNEIILIYLYEFIKTYIDES